MPLFTIAVQNAVPYRLLGVATSTVPFFRSLGGSVGLAIFGSIMSNSFTSQFTANLPPVVRDIVPPEQVAALAGNPEALASPEARATLSNILANRGAADETVLEQVLESLRNALSSAITDVFFIGFLVITAALVITFFISEIPLRKQHTAGDSIMPP
jgi:hypothetical protein